MSPPHDHRRLARVAVSGLKWNYSGNAIRAFCSIVINIILARILGPEPFGIVAIAWLVIGIGHLVADFGMGSAVVQREQISESDVRHAFTVQLCMGIGLTIILTLCAPLIAQFFNEPNVTAVVRAMSLIFVLQAFGAIARSLLIQLDFKRIQLAHIGSYLVGYVGLGIPLAFSGFHVWSLVFAQLLQTALGSIVCYAQVQHSIKPLLIGSFSGLTSFGSNGFVQPGVPSCHHANA
jgi:PST family polysaccharide transporter